MTREEAIKTIKAWDFLDNDKKDVLKTLIPELAENEHDRIKNRLIKLIKMSCEFGGFALHKWEADEMLDWLEKQGESDETKAKRFLINKGYPIDTNSTFPTYEEMYNIIVEGLKKQDEQKTTDKVELRFHEGDWIIFNENHNSIYQIERIDNYRYYLRHYLGGTLSVHFDNELIRPWTIQDAKDGDVLYLQHDGKEHIIIYKGVIKERFRTFISAYCAYNSIVDAFCFADVSRYADIAYGGIMPATKEQRDLLFQKMKDAGYEWDNEKKEVKKIVPIFNVGDIIAKKHNSDINKFGQFTITDVSGGKYWYDESIICDITEQDDWELVEQKSAEWSEEDEKRLQSCISSLQGKGFMGGVDTINTKWLKSIKQRIGG